MRWLTFFHKLSKDVLEIIFDDLSPLELFCFARCSYSCMKLIKSLPNIDDDYNLEYNFEMIMCQYLPHLYNNPDYMANIYQKDDLYVFGSVLLNALHGHTFMIYGSGPSDLDLIINRPDFKKMSIYEQNQVINLTSWPRPGRSQPFIMEGSNEYDCSFHMIMCPQLYTDVVVLDPGISQTQI